MYLVYIGLPFSEFNACNDNVIQLTSLTGVNDFRVVDLTASPDMCCFNIRDPPSFNPDDAHLRLSGPQQTYQCDIFPLTNSVGGFCTKIGREDCYAGDGSAPSFEFVTESENSVCANESSLCQTQVIFSVAYENHTEETRLYNDNSDMYFFNFTMIKVHYQVCGDDVLRFSLPISSTLPLNVTCSDVNAARPARTVDEECADLYTEPTTESVATTAEMYSSTVNVSAGGSIGDDSNESKSNEFDTCKLIPFCYLFTTLLVHSNKVSESNHKNCLTSRLLQRIEELI